MSSLERSLCCLSVTLALACAAACGQPPAANPAPASMSAMLNVGAPAPPIRATNWLNGKAVQIERQADSPVIVLTFVDTSAGPSRGALPALSALQERERQRGLICIAVTDEPTAEVQKFIEHTRPPLTIRVAIDDQGATAHAYCAAIGINFRPYSFIVARDGTIAWHGHPQQPELVQYVEQLLSGKYNLEQAREAVHRALTTEQLETVFREAYASQSWGTALLALDRLLEAGAPKDRLLRYKLAILLGEQRDQAAARALVAEVLKNYSANARLLNSLAWDVVSTDRLYFQDPEIGLQLSQAAYRASGGQDPAVLDTYARALHLLGRLDLAIAVQEKAVRLATDPERQVFQERLAFYRRCQALQANLTAEP